VNQVYKRWLNWLAVNKLKFKECLLNIKPELENIIVELPLSFKEGLLTVHPHNRMIVVRISLNLIQVPSLKINKIALRKK